MSIGKALRGLASYLRDWRNWVAHSIIGVILLIFMVWAPLPWYVRVGLMLAVIAFNVWRMRRAHRRKIQPQP